MNIFELIKKTFKQVIENPSITMILVLYLIVFSLLMKDFSITTNIPDIYKLVSVFLVSLCFASGWLHILKNVDSQEIKNNTFSLFAEGVGKNILPLFIGLIFYSTIILILAITTIYIATHAFGSLEFLYKDLSALPQNNNAFIEYFNNLSADKKFSISAWHLTFLAATVIFEFLFLFYFPALLQEKKINVLLKPFFAAGNTICFAFKNFFAVLFIYSSICIFHIAFSFINLIFSTNIVISALCLFINIYFISFSIMLIFNYYEQKNNSNNGCNSIGQDENIDRSSEEN